MINVLLIIFSLLISTACQVQNLSFNKDNKVLIENAMDIVDNSKFCVLITMDEKNSPQARIMDAFPPDENFVVWLATNPNSRKVNQIKINPKVVVFYTHKDDQGYLSIQGRAVLVNDKQSKEKYWKEEWSEFYPDRDKGLILIKVIPEYAEVINYNKKTKGDSITWQPPGLVFKK